MMKIVLMEKENDHSFRLCMLGMNKIRNKGIQGDWSAQPSQQGFPAFYIVIPSDLNTTKKEGGGEENIQTII